ncbi:MAG TPA: PPOX class F420-dependent oxidoreductase [Solirubrobacterales bacterium]|nr:PPOX class F420-dependent oxidoreductase [Solirubrobacterales bacterium]
MTKIPDDAVHLLEGQHLAHVATLQADGSPQVTPVWIGHEGDLVTFNTAKGRLKEKNLKRDPRVAISIVDADSPYVPLVIQGKVVEITEEGADDDINALAKRYLNEDVYPFRQPGEERLIVKIEPEKASYNNG